MSDPAAPVEPVAPTEPVVPPTEPVVEPKVEASPLGEKAPTDPAAPAEPIKYDFKIPEGMKLDETQLAAFNDLGNKLKLAPEAAQELFDYHAGSLKAVAEAIQKSSTDAAQAAYDNLIGGWKKELAADPELSGANADTAKEVLGKVLDQFGSKEAREAFDLTGAGWNPHIIRMMVKMGKALTEGGPTTIGNPTKGVGPKTPGSVFYPSKES